MKALGSITAAAALVLAVSASASTAVAEDDEDAQMLQSGSLVCVSAAAYDAAATAGSDEEAKCVAVSEDELEDMLAPFVRVEETNGDHVLVSFAVEHYKKLKLLHGSVTHVRYRGWTASKNLRNYYEWLTGKPQD